MGHSKASVSGSEVPLVTEVCKGGHWEKASTASLPEVPGNCNVIVLDSDDESGEADFQPSGSSFGSQRILELALQIDQEAMLSPSKSSVSSKMKHSKNRVLAVEGPGLAAGFDTKSPPAGKKSTPVVPLQGNYAKLTTALDGRTTAGPVLDFDKVKQEGRTTAGPVFDVGKVKQEAKTIRKRKSGGEAGKEVGPEQDNKENNGAKVQAKNGVKSENNGKKRKTVIDGGVHPEPSVKRSQSPTELAANGSATAEGKTCHQCRQRHGDVGLSLAWCTATAGKRACTQKYCAKCLLNRYGEVLVEVQAQDSWTCPRCRGICNCSMCMKKRGLAPTGGLAKQAIAAGYSSVADLLEKFPNVREERYTRRDDAAGTTNGAKESEPAKQESISPGRDQPPVDEDDDAFQTLVPGKSVKKEKDVIAPSLTGGGDQAEGVKKKKKRKTKNETEAEATADRVEAQSAAVDRENGVEGEGAIKVRKKRKAKAKVGVEQALIIREDLGEALHVLEEDAVDEEPPEEEILLPTGSPLVTVGDLTFPAEAVGPALQFLEFCATFEKPLRFKRAKAQKILAEMLRGGTLRRGSQSDIVQFHVQLLTIILDDVDDDSKVVMSAASNNCWVYHLERHLSEQFFLSRKDKDANSEQREEEEEEERAVSTSTSKATDFTLSHWPVSGEDIVTIVKALRSGVDGYGNLSIATRLQILASLCDSILTTKKLRNYLDKTVNSREAEQKENREELLAVKKQVQLRLFPTKEAVKENRIKEVLLAQTDSGSFSARDFEKMKREYAELCEKEAQLTETAAKLSGVRCEAVRTEPEAVHPSGSRFWRLKGVKDRESVVLQGIKNLESDFPSEDWAVFSEDQEEEVMSCITNLNTRKKAPAKILKRTRKKKAPAQVEVQASTRLDSELPVVPLIELSD
ncbi:hypothetical protein R1sor_013637 [Riccia sorocarpa]|uniref:DDT domain-containing protein n=1 Tax=Riccia sorocarpa TaxID=122646 RepID=A0ABD3H7A4_9MARC